MTIALDNVKTASRTVTTHSGTFASAPAPIHMDRWSGTGDFVPTAFKLRIESAISEDTRYVLEVITENGSNTYAHPALNPKNYEGETDKFKLIDCPDDIVEAVSTIPGVHIDNVVKQLRTVADIMRYV
jgi:hypothetical protein